MIGPRAGRDARSASRDRFLPDLPLGMLGLRVVLAPEVEAPRSGQAAPR